MIKISINVLKIEKDRLFVGKSGKYLDCVLVEKPDQYGNDGFVSQDVSKEERAQGKKGTIIGNWKHLGGGKQQSKPQQRQQRESSEDEDF